MSDQNKSRKPLKILFFLLFLISLSFNVALHGNLDKQSSMINNLYKYKKAYIKMTQILGISPEQFEALLEETQED